jgi:hypothetical protein
MVINFATPEIVENKKFIKNENNKLITGFPYQYFKHEILTNDMIQFRIGLIYIFFIIYIRVTFSVLSILAPIVDQSTFIQKPTSIEKLISNQDKLVTLRGGSVNIPAFIIKVLFIWTMINNSQGTEGFNPKPINYQYFGHQEYRAQNFRVAPKLQENPVDRNNFGQPSWKSSNTIFTIFMDELANSLSPEYTEFQRRYFSESLEPRFDTLNYSVEEFTELAKDTRSNVIKYDRVSIDEARAIVQAQSENLVIAPTRLDTKTARRVDLDYKVEGPLPYTHVDVKQPEILSKQNQTRSLEDMAYLIGQKIVDQKSKFVGLENGPAGPENVCHIVDLCYVPLSEKTIVKEKILQGGLDKGSTNGIIFINDIETLN